MAKKEDEVIEEPTLEDLEDEDLEDNNPQNSDEETEKETVETESLEARVENEKKAVEDADETEGSFISVIPSVKIYIELSKNFIVVSLYFILDIIPKGGPASV